MAFTPTHLIDSPPDKRTLASFVNKPSIKIMALNNSAHEINRQHTYLQEILYCKGFGLTFEGMSITVHGGSCLLNLGTSVRAYTHVKSKFHIQRQIPTPKSETFFLALGLSRSFDGEGILGIFSEKAIPDNFVRLRKIFLPAGSSDFSSSQVTNLISTQHARIYNYVTNQPDGRTRHFLIPFATRPDSVKVFLGGKAFHDYTLVRAQRDILLLVMDSPPAAGVRLLLDFDVL